jgi:TolB-like protein/tetratricopeptide (TPR) repeat protein
MKRCPVCRRDYHDETLLYCLDDGSALLEGPASTDDPETAILHRTSAPAEARTMVQMHTTERTEVPPARIDNVSESKGLDRRLIFAPAFLAVILLGGFLAYRYVAPTKQIESIAVMPFVNEGGNADVEYLSDGMTETLIKSLSQVPHVAVKSRSAVFVYKGKETSPRRIGEELGVQAVLLGRISTRGGEELRLNLELVNTQTQDVIWSEQYTRNHNQLVSLQSEIASDVSGKLKARLSGADAAKVTKTYTADPEAYQLYLKGRYQWNRRTPESLKQAVQFFDQAVLQDPNYALAYSGLAETYVLFPNYSVAMPMDCMPKAKAAALRAIELDDSLAETHTALGTYYSLFAWNHAAAEKEFRRAIELNPDYATGHQQFGIECLTGAGRLDEAVAESRRAVELDPVSPIIAADLGNVLFRARRFDEAIQQLDHALALDPNFWVTRWYLGQAYHAKGQYGEAVTEYQKALASNDNPWVKSQLIRSLAKAGQRDQAAKLLSELEVDSTRRVVSSASLALAYGGIGDKVKAFAYLNKEISERNSRPPVFAVNPLWDDFRNEAAFTELIHRVEQMKLD